MNESVSKTKELVKRLPVIKPHLDLLAAILTIPVLLTVFILNFSTLSKNSKNVPQPTPFPSPTPTPSHAVSVKAPVHSLTVIPVTASPTPTASVTPQPSGSCSPTIGPISIASPSEGATASSNPVCIEIDYTSQGYCSSVWAYKINNGPLSDYSNNSVCLYNLPNGPVTFELDVKSLVSSDTKILQRNFVYQRLDTTPTATPSPSTTLTPSPTSSQ